MPSWERIDRGVRIALLLVLAADLWAQSRSRTVQTAMAADLAEVRRAVEDLGQHAPAAPLAGLVAPERAQAGRAEAARGEGRGAAKADRSPSDPRPDPSGAQGAAPTGASASGGGRSRMANLRRSLTDNGVTVMDVVYDAVDRMAEEEGWDETTYNAVAATFEDSAGGLVQLMQEVQAGDRTAAEARELGAALREDALVRIQETLGPEGAQRLRGYFKNGLGGSLRGGDR
ncbi:MAG: hypothetical protein RLZZ383_2923 [Pseudomonadota bacterium]|jgi:hypothetical protein